MTRSQRRDLSSKPTPVAFHPWSLPAERPQTSHVTPARDQTGYGEQLRLNDLLAGPLCGDEAVDAKLQAFITRKLSGVQALLAKAAATTGRKRHRALKGMDHRLAAIQNRTRRDVRKREVSFRCGYIIIAQEIMPLRQTIMAIR